MHGERMNEQRNNPLLDGTPQEGQGHPQNEPQKQNKIVWLIVFIVIAAASIWAVTAQNKDFTLHEFLAYVKGASPLWICAAVVSMLAFIIVEAFIITYICRALGYKCKWKNSFFYSATDIYFSAITPSATGGQPACAYLMVKEGIPGAVVTAALLMNLMMYAVSLVVIGIIAIIIRPEIFTCFNSLSKILIITGCIIQLGLSLLFYLLLYKDCFLYQICGSTLRLLAKIHLVHGVDEKMAKLEATMQEYQQCAKMFKDRKWVLLNTLFFNVLQRIAQTAVTVFVFLAFGGTFRQSLDIWAIQNFVLIGACCIPVPGAMGVTDYLMLDGFGAVMAAQQAAHLELLSRTLSFYCCILVCGLAVIFKFYLLKKRSKT